MKGTAMKKDDAVLKRIAALEAQMQELTDDLDMIKKTIGSQSRDWQTLRLWIKKIWPLFQKVDARDRDGEAK